MASAASHAATARGHADLQIGQAARALLSGVVELSSAQGQEVRARWRIIIPVGDALSFDALQLRLHPAESRVLKLAQETPAELMVFDLLEASGECSLDSRYRTARGARAVLCDERARRDCMCLPCTRPRDGARLAERSGGALDGVIAKRRDLEYRSGERAMIKVKQQRTADCVVGGFRYAEKKRVVGRSCSASTTIRACSTTSGSPRLFRRGTAGS